MITALCDEYPRLLGRHREIFVAVLLTGIYICALPTTTYVRTAPCVRFWRNVLYLLCTCIHIISKQINRAMCSYLNSSLQRLSGIVKNFPVFKAPENLQLSFEMACHWSMSCNKLIFQRLPYLCEIYVNIVPNGSLYIHLSFKNDPIFKFSQ